MEILTNIVPVICIFSILSFLWFYYLISFSFSVFNDFYLHLKSSFIVFLDRIRDIKNFQIFFVVLAVLISKSLYFCVNSLKGFNCQECLEYSFSISISDA